MLDKDKLLAELTILKDEDEERVRKARSVKEKNARMGSFITLTSIIEYINKGYFDKK